MPKELYNSVILVGNAGADPDVRYFESGFVRCELRIAVYAGKDKASGEPKPPYWFTIKALNETAEWIANHIKRGDRVKITEGQLAQDSWQDRETGKTRTKDYVLAWKIEKVERRPVENNTGFDSYDETF